MITGLLVGAAVVGAATVLGKALALADRPQLVPLVPRRRRTALTTTWNDPVPVDPDAEWNDPEHPDSTPDGDPVPVPDGPDHTAPAVEEVAAHG